MKKIITIVCVVVLSVWSVILFILSFSSGSWTQSCLLLLLPSFILAVIFDYYIFPPTKKKKRIFKYWAMVYILVLLTSIAILKILYFLSSPIYY